MDMITAAKSNLDALKARLTPAELHEYMGYMHKAALSGLGDGDAGLITAEGLEEAGEWYSRAMHLYTSKLSRPYANIISYSTYGQHLDGKGEHPVPGLGTSERFHTREKRDAAKVQSELNQFLKI